MTLCPTCKEHIKQDRIDQFLETTEFVHKQLQIMKDMACILLNHGDESMLKNNQDDRHVILSEIFIINILIFFTDEY